MVQECDLSRIFSLGDYNNALVIAFLLKKFFKFCPFMTRVLKLQGSLILNCINKM